MADKAEEKSYTLDEEELSILRDKVIPMLANATPRWGRILMLGPDEHHTLGWIMLKTEWEKKQLMRELY